MSHEVLIVDDEADIRELVSGILEDEGYQARSAGEAAAALAAVDQRLPALVILDIWLQGSKIDGLEVLDRLKVRYPDLPVVVISGHGTIETAVSALKRGAYDFVEKPFNSDKLVVVVGRALEAARLKRENLELRVRAGQDGEVIGAGAAMSEVRGLIERAAPANSRVMFSGPPGSGKEVCARLLHTRSRRSEGPFVVLNAASMAPERMEAELFGIEGKGGEGEVFRVGVLERAHLGTLFIDEVADMPLETQAKILRVLVDQTFERVGGNRRVKVDARIVSATSRDLKAEIAAGRFREDLYYRLNVVGIPVPPLVARREDVPDLVRYFIGQVAKGVGLAARVVSEDAMAALQTYPWPGNVRQLRNVIEQMLIMAPGDATTPIRAAHLPPDIASEAPSTLKASESEDLMALPLRDARELFERQYLLAQLLRFGHNISRTAEFVGMERSALHRKLKSLGVSGGNGRGGPDSADGEGGGGGTTRSPSDAKGGEGAGRAV
ncbi:MAG: sigma-54-dependent Fis family transcriptional regulator [Alphaproteobacteria bacterium]|nr:sigma-54-dependent Fis family transcriptional regulator [Alphaproteobacteria bacterium]